VPDTSASADLLLSYSITDDAFRSAIEAAAHAAPVVGTEASAAPPVALAHYSRSAAPITAFAHNGGYSWTNRVSQDPRAIGEFTGLFGEPFHALYIIRRVDHPGLRHRGSGLMEEYAIDLALAASDFVRIPLRLASDGGVSRYVVA